MSVSRGDGAFESKNTKRDSLSSRPWEVYPNKPCYELRSTEGFGIGTKGEPKYFEDLNSACRFAANLYAMKNRLPNGNYYLEWEIALKDEQQQTRIYVSKYGNFAIIAHVI